MLLVLETVARGPTTIAKATGQTGLDRNTVRRLLVNLEERRLVVRDLLGRYVIGPKLAELCENRLQDPLQHETSEVLQHLQRAIKADAALYWADGCYRICIGAAAEPRRAEYLRIGARLEPSNCASCLVLLAWSAPRRFAAPQLLVSTSQYQLIRQQGWASSVDPDGIGAIAAPVRDSLGEVVAAVAIFGGSVLASAPAAKLIAPLVIAASNQLADAMTRAPR